MMKCLSKWKYVSSYPIFHTSDVSSYLQWYFLMHLYFFILYTFILFSNLLSSLLSPPSPTQVLNQHAIPSACFVASLFLSICLSVCFFLLSVQYIPQLACPLSTRVALLQQIGMFVTQTLIASRVSLEPKIIIWVGINLIGVKWMWSINGLRPTDKDKG